MMKNVTLVFENCEHLNLPDNCINCVTLYNLRKNSNGSYHYQCDGVTLMLNENLKGLTYSLWGTEKLISERLTIPDITRIEYVDTNLQEYKKVVLPFMSNIYHNNILQTTEIAAEKDKLENYVTVTVAKKTALNKK